MSVTRTPDTTTDPAAVVADYTARARTRSLSYLGPRATREGLALVEVAGLGWWDTAWTSAVAVQLARVGEEEDVQMWSAAVAVLDTMPRRTL